MYRKKQNISLGTAVLFVALILASKLWTELRMSNYEPAAKSVPSEAQLRAWYGQNYKLDRAHPSNLNLDQTMREANRRIAVYKASKKKPIPSKGEVK